MTNNPIVEQVVDTAPTPVQGLDLQNHQRPAPNPQFAVSKPYEQANTPALDQLDTFIDTKWHVKREDMSHTCKVVIKMLSDYIEKMGPGSVLTPPEKARQQVQLYKAIILALNAEPDQSLIALQIIMFLIKGYKTTVFSDRCALEASDITSFTRDEHKTFRSILMLLISTCDPVTRKVVLARQVDLRKVVGTLQTQKMQDALVRFYNIIKPA
jgi:hypothetical protein